LRDSNVILCTGSSLVFQMWALIVTRAGPPVAACRSAGQGSGAISPRSLAAGLCAPRFSALLLEASVCRSTGPCR